MINVVDRVPTYPNRIKVTHADGTSEYVTWERADEPTVVGTPINKALFDSIVEDIGLNKNTTVYVSTAGSDTLGDGTAANPYATITKALNSIPKNLNGYDATISITAGTYDEDVLVSKTFGGVVIFSGLAEAQVNIRSLRVKDGVLVRVQNIQVSITGNYGGIAIEVEGAELICVSNISLIGNAENGVFVNRNGFFCAFGNIVVNNTSYSAIFSTNRSSVFVSRVSGSNHASAFMRSINGSLLSYFSLEGSASVMFATASGGRIYSGAQTSIPNY